MTRRTFLRVAALAGGGLVVACGSSEPVATTASPVIPGAPGGTPWQPNAFIRITPDNRVTVIVGSTEVGQGTLTAVPMLVAEELDADWALVDAERAPAGLEYANPKMFMQVTGQSNTIAGEYSAQRTAGAAVRQMLVQAAAQRWSVDAVSLRTEASQVIHDASGRRATYGALATEAAAQSVPASPVLKDPATFRIVGTSKQRLDAPAKVNGTAQFGLDFDMPGLLTALVARAPRFGGRATTFDATATLAIPGVVAVYQIPSGVAVVAQDFWSAKLGRDALSVEWNDAAAETRSTVEVLDEYRQRMDLPGEPFRTEGSVEAAQLAAAQQLSADYEFPYLAHAPMEPLNTVIDYRGDSAEVWCGSQWPAADWAGAAAVLGLPVDAVKFNVMLAGGGFGRRLNPFMDFVTEAAQIAKQLQQPVKVVWTREDDVRGGFYRTTAVCRLGGTLDADNALTSWTHRIAGQPNVADALVEDMMMKAGLEVRLTQGAAEMPYAVQNVRVDAHSMVSPVTVQWMRSVSNSFNVFAVEAFVDELAQAAGADPYEFRRGLLGAQPRHRGVLDAVAAASGWNTPAPAGVHRGIAVFTSYGSYIAQVVEVSVGADRLLTVRRVVSAVDCGVAVNPDLVKAQIESAVVFALTSVLFGEITLDEGRVVQANFHDYPMLRIYQTPAIETVIVPSAQAPGGVGELGVPCVGPALVNAIFRATGERIRKLPLRRQNLRIA